MSANVINQVAYLRTTREFPDELYTLSVETNKAYLDIANAVNQRIIGIHSTNRSAVTGESWFFNNKRQQGFRQIYNIVPPIISGTTIDLGFKIASISKFTPKCYGSFSDGTNWYGIIFGTNISIPGQISFFIFLNTLSNVSDQIVFKVGAGAPALTNGIVLIEWISDI